MAKTPIFSKEKALARFWELKAAIEASEERIAPLRKARDAAVNEAAAADKKAMAEIRKIEDEAVPGMSIFDARQEMAFLARGLREVGASAPEDQG